MSENVHYLRAARRPPRAAVGDALFADDPEGAQLNELLDAIYEGPLTRPPWRDALRRLQQRLDAAHVALILCPPSADEFGTMVHIGSEDAAAMESYTKRLFALDPFVHLREGDVVTPEELIGEKWLDGPIYRDYLKPLDVRYLLGADFYTPDGIECRLRITRPHGAAPFGDDERTLSLIHI